MVETSELSDVNQHTENTPFTMVFSARTGILSANTMVNPSFIRIERTNERKSILHS